MFGDLLNSFSSIFLGYDVAIKDDKGELLILPIGKYSYALTSSFACFIIYLFSAFFFDAFSQTYQKLPRREKMFWNLAVLRGVYGTFGAISAFYCRYYDEHLMSHMTDTRTDFSYFLVLSNLGFFIFEIVAQIYFDVHFRTFSKALMLHHIVSLVGFWTTTHEDKGHYYILMGFIIEFSTPFSCICYCLIKSKLEHTVLWKANQLILIHIFHMRTIVEWKMIYDLFYYWSEFGTKMSLIWQVNTFIGLFSVGCFLTPYWTFRKTEQFFNRKDWNADQHHNHHANQTHHDESHLKSKKQ